MEELKMGGNWEKNGRKWVMERDSGNRRSGWIVITKEAVAFYKETLSMRRISHELSYIV